MSGVEGDDLQKKNYLNEKCRKFSIDPDKDTNGVIGVNDFVLVYLDKSDNLMWTWNLKEDQPYFKSVSKQTATAQVLTSRISSLFKRSLFGGYSKEAAIAKRLVGAGLFAGINASVASGNVIVDENYFAEAQEFINTKIKESTHIAYLTASFSFFLMIFVSIAIYATVCELDISSKRWLPDQFKDILAVRQLLIAILCGSTGALLSVVQRFKEIPIQNYMSKSYMYISAIIRIVLGIIFGILFIVAVKGGVILGTDADSYVVVLFIFISGFSERLVPELLKKLETTVTSNGVDVQQKS